MSDTLELTICHAEDIPLIFTALHHLERRSGYHFSALHSALEELIENILHHAYHVQKSTPINIHVNFTFKACQLKITVQEFGEPFDFTPYLSEPITKVSDHSKGFYRIYDLVDTFYFTSLGKEGKQFTLISQLSQCQISEIKKADQHSQLIQPNREEIVVRDFKAGDESAISRLIYQNYDYTYYKSYFYNPRSIKEDNENGKIHSFVAEYRKNIMGHFALIPHQNTNSAEVAVAVVQPQFKGIGVMNRMFIKVIDHAKTMHFRSLFGEAIMLHPYSQKANLKKGMRESAVVLGLVPDDIEIEHNLKIDQRSGVLLGYLLFEKSRSLIHMPTRYQKWIEACYGQFDLLFTKRLVPLSHAKLDIHIDTELNLVSLEINADLSEQRLTQEIETLLLKQTDMIYADINLHRIQDIDKMVAHLNHHGFFYSGVLFDYYHSEDYLRLQKICSTAIDTEHLVTYSEFATTLLDFIKEDMKQIKQH